MSEVNIFFNVSETINIGGQQESVKAKIIIIQLWKGRKN